MTNEPRTSAEAESKAARAEAVHQALSGDDEGLADTEQPTGGPEGRWSDEQAPEGVGESTTRRGEDIVDDDGKEPGRVDTGSDGGRADRPTGGSDGRDATGVGSDDTATDGPFQGGQGGH
jgi:hypothetical protein